MIPTAKTAKAHFQKYIKADPTHKWVYNWGNKVDPGGSEPIFFSPWIARTSEDEHDELSLK